MDIRSKIWLEIDGEPVFGSGRMALLEGIARSGSINKAANGIHISYRKALSYINAMEERMRVKLVERHAGGKNGGGATLTKEAEGFLRKYKMLEDGINKIIDRKFSSVFKKPKNINTKSKQS
jgi:molybdate transport system regulatory protein